MLRTQRAVLAAKIESVEGTAESLTATEGILALAADFKRNHNMLQRDPLRPTFSQLARVPGARTANLTCQIEAKGSGTAGTAPEWGPLLRACGFGETVVPATSVTYLPVSTGEPTITAAIYREGKRNLLAGARGNVQLGGSVGELLALNFNFLGVEDDVSDVAIIAPTYQSTVPQPLLSTSFSLHSYAAKCTSFSIDLGATITPRDDMSQASGYFSAIIGNRVPVGNFVIEDDLVATKDWYGIMEAGTEGALSITLGATAGNIITVTAPKVQIVGITEQDSGGIQKLSLDVAVNMNSGDDEISIALT